MTNVPDKDELKKVAENIELNDDDLDMIAGGYSSENWLKMSPAERVAAYKESKAAREQDGNAYCAYYDPNA